MGCRYIGGASAQRLGDTQDQRLGDANDQRFSDRFERRSSRPGGARQPAPSGLRFLSRHDPQGGGLGPALTQERLAVYDVDTLTTIILEGLPGTAMPPWRDLLSAEEARWIAETLKHTDAQELP